MEKKKQKRKKGIVFGSIKSNSDYSFQYETCDVLAIHP